MSAVTAAQLLEAAAQCLKCGREHPRVMKTDAFRGDSWWSSFTDHWPLPLEHRLMRQLTALAAMLPAATDPEPPPAAAEPAPAAALQAPRPRPARPRPSKPRP